MSGYDDIKRLAKVRQCPVSDLLVLARQNDPFFVGSGTSRKMAEWFADLWQQFGYTTGIHLRRVHYQVANQERKGQHNSFVKHNALPYENTENDWSYMCGAGKYARILDLVDPEAFVDRRNPEPRIFAPTEAAFEEDPSWQINFPAWFFPRISTDLTRNLEWDMPSYMVCGYQYSEALQPYHLEVWVEKSTQDDILLPLCRRYGVNLVTGLGYMSITQVWNLLKRVVARAKPCRLFYISDFDPSGDGMPTAVARQIEFWLSRNARNLDIKLAPVLMTREQVERYRLPRIPLKESDKNKANFEQRYGEGAVELDAMEALHPGEMAQIVKGHLLKCRDPDLADNMDEVRDIANEELQSAWEERIEPHEEKLDDLKYRATKILDSYQVRLAALNAEMEAELSPYQEELHSIRHAIQEEMDKIAVALPDCPKPEVKPDGDKWLFDSSRDYFEQLAVYKARKA